MKLYQHKIGSKESRELPRTYINNNNNMTQQTITTGLGAATLLPRAPNPEPPTPTLPPTPTPPQVGAESTRVYYGWYSEALQRLRVLHPTEHIFKGSQIFGPTYMYYSQGNRKVLVTEVSHTWIPTPRQVKNGDICVGRVDMYLGRTHRLLREDELQTDM